MLRDLRDQGVCRKTIATVLGRTVSSVRGRSRTLGIEDVRPRISTKIRRAIVKARWEEGKTPSEIARKFGLKVKTVSAITKTFGRPTNDEDVADRKCLSCGNMFLSTHKGNRKCPRCARLPEMNAGDWLFDRVGMVA